MASSLKVELWTAGQVGTVVIMVTLAIYAIFGHVRKAVSRPDIHQVFPCVHSSGHKVAYLN
jgi:hypothetical protein